LPDLISLVKRWASGATDVDYCNFMELMNFLLNITLPYVEVVYIIGAGGFTPINGALAIIVDGCRDLNI